MMGRGIVTDIGVFVHCDAYIGDLFGGEGISLRTSPACRHLTILLMKRNSSFSLSRIGLKDVSLRGGLYKLKNAPRFCVENA